MLLNMVFKRLSFSFLDFNINFIKDELLGFKFFFSVIIDDKVK